MRLHFLAGIHPRGISNVNPAAPAETKPAGLEPHLWVERYGDPLFRYAWARLRDRAAAEDLVQETLLEAFKSRDSFKGTSSEKSWLFSILRHNLLDFFRRKNVRESATFSEDELDSELHDLFEPSGWHKGKWKQGSEPLDWNSPEDLLSRQEFWNVFHRCTSKLPPATARVLLLREIDGLPSTEICGLAGITQSNLWVLLHRARLALQSCLQQNWFK